MSNKVLKSEIAYLIETIGEQFVTVDQHEIRIPQIEIDLMMENVRRMYECMYHLKKINDGLSEPARAMSAPSPVIDHTEPVAPDQKGEITDLMAEPDAPENLDIEPEETELVLTNPLANDLVIEVPVIEEPPAEQFKSEKEPVYIKPPVLDPKKNKTTDNAKTIDLFAPSATVADKFQEPSENLASKIKNHQITDLKSAIGINDKFLFINDLFDGNMKSYSMAIDILNSLSSFEEAVAHIDKIKSDGKRVRNLETIGRLTELVQRRYL